MSEQLVLPLKLSHEIDFNSFVPGSNQELITYLQNLPNTKTEKNFYLWGQEGAGKSHLLQALCNHFLQQQQSAFYLDGLEILNLQPELFEALEQYNLICLDNVDAFANHHAWEEALFHLYNRMRASAHYLVVTAKKNVATIPWQLADIQSRLNWGLNYQVHGLKDDEKIDALQLISKNKGMILSDEVCHYLIHHFSRNMHHLIQFLKQVENKSLIEKKRVTIPFIKTVFPYTP